MTENLQKPIRKHITDGQKEAMLVFMEKHGDISTCITFSIPQGRQKKNDLLEELAVELNSFPSGVCRTAKEWLRCWTDYKSKTKKRAAEINRHMRGTGGGRPLDMPPLSRWEERVVRLMSTGIMSGLNVMEAGLADSTDSPTIYASVSEVGPSFAWRDGVTIMDPLLVAVSSVQQTDHEYIVRREEETSPNIVQESDHEYTKREDATIVSSDNEESTHQPFDQQQHGEQQQRDEQQQLDNIMKRFANVAEESNRSRQLLEEKIVLGQQLVAAAIEAGFSKLTDTLATGLQTIVTSQHAIAASQQAIAASQQAIAASQQALAGSQQANAASQQRLADSNSALLMEIAKTLRK